MSRPVVRSTVVGVEEALTLHVAPVGPGHRPSTDCPCMPIVGRTGLGAQLVIHRLDVPAASWSPFTALDAPVGGR